MKFDCFNLRELTEWMLFGHCCWFFLYFCAIHKTFDFCVQQTLLGCTGWNILLWLYVLKLLLRCVLISFFFIIFCFVILPDWLVCIIFLFLVFKIKWFSPYLNLIILIKCICWSVHKSWMILSPYICNTQILLKCYHLVYCLLLQFNIFFF